MDIVSQQKSDDQRDEILDRIQLLTVWFNTEKKPPRSADSDATGCVWAFYGARRVGMALYWYNVAADPRSYPVWTHTPNIPLSRSTILGGKP